MWDAEGVSLAAVILLSAAIGVVLVGPALWIERWRLRRRVRDLEARLAAAPRVEAPRVEAPRVEAPPSAP
jgi:hypothetical protein